MGTRTVCFYGELPTVAQYVQPLHHGQTFPLSNVLIRRYAWEMRPYWMCLQDQLVMFKHVCSYIFDLSTSSIPRPVSPLGNPMPAWDLILQRFPDYEDPQFPHRLLSMVNHLLGRPEQGLVVGLSAKANGQNRIGKPNEHL